MLEDDLVQPSSYSNAHIYVRYYCLNVREQLVYVRR